MAPLFPTSANKALAATAAASDATPPTDRARVEPGDTTLAAESAESAATPGDRGPMDLTRGALVGRYVVLSKLGAGGMGVVFAGYDPELDRKVALKLLRPQPDARGSAGRTRLVREAQALAKLNHPHIVAIHDVGEHKGAVWLAMEYVDGVTLSAWLQQPRTWREILAVMLPVAEGLAAAHAARLVHRDIKPDNIMLGADTRARVMDLGLARALAEENPTPVSPDAPTAEAKDFEALALRVTQAGAILGTPTYMSPEQFRGEPVDARADVFSYCVTLWEALMGERPFAGKTLVELAANVLLGRVRPAPRTARVPAWLRHVCLQGLAVDPDKRIPSMQALLAALTHGRTRARTRKGLVVLATVAILGGSAALIQRHAQTTRIAACEAVGASIDEIWNDEARSNVRTGILATGLSYAPVTAERVMPFLDAQTDAWREHRTRACVMSDVDGTLDPEHLDRAVWCLDERRMELAALMAELSHADAAIVQKVVPAVAGLQPVSLCTDGRVLAALPPPPPADARAKADVIRIMLSQARTHLWTGRYPDGLQLTRTALEDAVNFGWSPLTAAARHLEGHFLDRAGAFAESEAAHVTAYMEAAKVQAWDVAFLAAVHLVYTVGVRQARHAEATVWARHAEVAGLFAGDPLGLREAGRLNNLAILHQVKGSYAEAKPLHERALAIRETALGREHPSVAGSLSNLCLVHKATGAYAEARVLCERALAILEKAYGPEHPDVAASLSNLANVYMNTGAYAKARALHERVLAIEEKALSPEHPDLAASLDSMGVLASAMGALADAKAFHERALAIKEKAYGPKDPRVAVTLDNLGGVHKAMGAYHEAKTLHERALAIHEKAVGPEHPDFATALDNLAAIHRATGALAEAKMLHERALAIREKALGLEHPRVAQSLGQLGGLADEQDQPNEARSLLERAVAIYDTHDGVQQGELEFRFDLAMALVRTKGDLPRALAEARKAAHGYSEAGAGKAKELAEVEAFLAKYGGMQ